MLCTAQLTAQTRLSIVGLRDYDYPLVLRYEIPPGPLSEPLSESQEGSIEVRRPEQGRGITTTPITLLISPKHAPVSHTSPHKVILVYVWVCDCGIEDLAERTEIDTTSRDYGKAFLI